MSITVVIPVVNQIIITDQLCSQMLTNTVLPSEVIILDNGSKDNYDSLAPKFQKLNLRVIHFEKNIGVNAAWNRGIAESKTVLISVLNNDIVISRFFFQKLLETFKFPEVGIAFPIPVKDMKKIYNCSENRSPLQDSLPSAEGHAWTIRTIVARKIKPIPSELFRGFGDYYMSLCSSTLGYRNVVMLNNIIFHYGGLTTKREFPGKRGLPFYRQEAPMYKKIVNNIQDYIIK